MNTTPNQGSATPTGPTAPPIPSRPPVPQPPSKIQHTQPGFGGTMANTGQAAVPVDPARPLPMAAAGPLTGGTAKITAFGRERRHEDSWTRTPNTTGNGAIHVKTFHCKLTEDALVYMDQAINEWLDAHPQYEVKFVSSTIGTMTGKLKEPAMFCQIWV